MTPHPSLIDIRSPNLPAASDSGESITAHLIRRPGRAEVIADPPPPARPRMIRISRYIASSQTNKICRELGADPWTRRLGQGTERIFHTNAEPSTVMTATDRNRVGYPPSWLTSGAAIADAGRGTAEQQYEKALHRGTAVRLAYYGARTVVHRWSLLPRVVPSPGAGSWLIPRDIDQHAKHAAK